MIRNLWFGETIKEAIDSPRFHHQLYPMKFSYEDRFPEASYRLFLIIFISISMREGTRELTISCCVELNGIRRLCTTCRQRVTRHTK